MSTLRGVSLVPARVPAGFSGNCSCTGDRGVRGRELPAASPVCRIGAMARWSQVPFLKNCRDFAVAKTAAGRLLLSLKRAYWCAGVICVLSALGLPHRSRTPSSSSGVVLPGAGTGDHPPGCTLVSFTSPRRCPHLVASPIYAFRLARRSRCRMAGHAPGPLTLVLFGGCGRFSWG